MWHLLEAAKKRIDGLESGVEQASLPLSAQGRELVTFLAQEVRFTAPYKMEEKRAVYYNGDVDSLVLTRVSARVQTRYTSQDKFLRSTTTRRASGFEDGGDYFDFSWNYLIGSTQSLYSRDYLSSNVLASGEDRAQMFNFPQPLRLPRGESLEFRVLPTSFAPPPYVLTTEWVVTFVLLGYRWAE